MELQDQYNDLMYHRLGKATDLLLKLKKTVHKLWKEERFNPTRKNRKNELQIHHARNEPGNSAASEMSVYIV